MSLCLSVYFFFAPLLNIVLTKILRVTRGVAYPSLNPVDAQAFKNLGRNLIQDFPKTYWGPKFFNNISRRVTLLCFFTFLLKVNSYINS
jgi:hypothetical protein